MNKDVIISDPDILNGTPVFRDTRVPVQALFDYLRFSTLNDFLEGYPQISRSMVDEALSAIAQKALKPRRAHASA
jgi:uncharacterized protein (DUF433 family)